MKYLTLKKLAKEKSIPISSIRKFIKTGLPHYRPGAKKVFINPDEFDQWFADSFRVEAEPGSDDIGQIVEDIFADIG